MLLGSVADKVVLLALCPGIKEESSWPSPMCWSQLIFLRQRSMPCTMHLRKRPYIAHKRDADLIVMGIHKRTGRRHVLLGSVAGKVARLAPCPVLTVRYDVHEAL